MMVRPGSFWVRSWTARHSLKLKAGGKGRDQDRPGRASAERAWRDTYREKVDFAYRVQIQRVHLISERPGEKSGLSPPQRWCSSGRRNPCSRPPLPEQPPQPGCVETQPGARFRQRRRVGLQGAQQAFYTLGAREDVVEPFAAETRQRFE